jgi:hypothetical protein
MTQTRIVAFLRLVFPPRPFVQFCSLDHNTPRVFLLVLSL